MAEAITDELRKMVGRETPPEVYDVEKGWVKKFAQAIGDPNPLWQDEAYAKKTKYGGIIAPPTFVTGLRPPDDLFMKALAASPLPRLLNGGNEVEYFKPIKVGDVITVTGKLTDLREREGKMGKMLFMIFDIYFKNQKGELVAKLQQTLIKY